MKRSEMIEHINKFVNKQLQYSNTFNSADSEQLLLTMEAAGMLPPPTQLPIFGVTDNAWGEE